jgi:electron transport complex protein RnfB
VIQEIFMPVAVVGGLGLVFGLGLAYASKKFEVKVDETVARIREVLPGANCGACGQAGCDEFAECVAAGDCKVNGCPVGGQEVADKIAEILGVESEGVVPQTARVMCRGSRSVSRMKFEYDGIEDCAAAASLYGGPNACSYGCVGMGNCVRACAFDAIVIVDGLARIAESKCTACGKCVAACPKRIIDIVPRSSEYTVTCSSLDRGNIVRKNCDVGCIGCGRCVRVCPKSAITMDGTLAKIDPYKCDNCGECIKVCPTNAINYIKCEVILLSASEGNSF